jgi:hypothetical protein
VLSRNGVDRLSDSNSPRVNVCCTCYERLFVRKIMPLFAIANGFLIGQIPRELRDSTIVELALVLSCHVFVVVGRRVLMGCGLVVW